MPDNTELTQHQRRLRLYAWICALLTVITAVLWNFEVLYAQGLCGAFLLLTCLLSARISDISIRRAKDRKAAAKVPENSIG
jgi:hypothetical protein